ncbi:MAG: hypothetical protein NC131_10840 [Roseburia sp.]|nr:hypothetical protein [Roseburia sp.]
MKLKKVVSLCLQQGQVNLLNQVDKDGVVTQWMGDGGAFYPLNGVPFLDEGTLCTVFDVPEKKQEKILIQCMDFPAGLDVADYTAGDRGVETLGVSIGYGGTTLLPMKIMGAGAGIVYIQKKYLAPLEDTADVLQFCVRTDTTGRRYVAVHAGLLIAAIIFPYDLLNEDFVATMSSIVDLTDRELEAKKRLGAYVEPREEPDQDQRTLFDGGGEGGEDGEA